MIHNHVILFNDEKNTLNLNDRLSYDSDFKMILIFWKNRCKKERGDEEKKKKNKNLERNLYFIYPKEDEQRRWRNME